LLFGCLTKELNVYMPMTENKDFLVKLENVKLFHPVRYSVKSTALCGRILDSIKCLNRFGLRMLRS